ncbi:hypothetical protein GIB67_006877, partial [Kingdonia uniflora]
SLLQKVLLTLEEKHLPYDMKLIDLANKPECFAVVNHALHRRLLHSTDSDSKQDRAEKRPSMGKVAKMLEGTVDMDVPGMPTIFYLGDNDA